MSKKIITKDEKTATEIVEKKKEMSLIEELMKPITNSIEKIFDKYIQHSKLKLDYSERQNTKIIYLVCFILVIVSVLSIFNKINETALVSLLSLIIGYSFGAFSTSQSSQFINSSELNKK